MKTNLLSLLAGVAIAAGLLSSSTLRAEALAPVVETTAAAQWEKHVTAQTPAGLSLTAVEWVSQANSKKVAFRATVSLEAPRYLAMRFFDAKCSGAVAQLRDSFLAAGQPMEYLKPLASAGDELVIGGSFALRLDGTFGAVVWNKESTLGLGDDSKLPKEDSDYTKSLKAKISEMRTAQTASDMESIVSTIGKLSGKVAEVTGNREAKVVEETAKVLTGETNSPTAATPAKAGKSDMKNPIEQGVRAVSGLAGLFKK